MRFLIPLSRALGRYVCHLRGHDYFFPNGCINSWCAYTCVRCGELSRPLESLPPAPDDEHDFDWFDADDDARIEEEHARARRWFSALPIPRWL